MGIEILKTITYYFHSLFHSQEKKDRKINTVILIKKLNSLMVVFYSFVLILGNLDLKRHVLIT